jgi:hypothetical protein
MKAQQTQMFTYDSILPQKNNGVYGKNRHMFWEGWGLD